MIHQNIVIHGASETEILDNGAAAPLRVPITVQEQLSDSGKTQNRNVTGIELRFVINSGDVILHLCAPDTARGEITVYYGDFVADWPETTKRVEGNCEVVIRSSPNIVHMRKIAKEYRHRFSPDVVRLVFQGVRPQICRIEGDISLPAPDQLPARTYLAYGSSITHGSISLHPYYNYAERVGAHFGADVLNLGFAGSACLEPAMADHIADNCTFDFATLEMGINILHIDPLDFKQRVRYFVRRIAEAHPDAVIFAIDVYTCSSDIAGDGKAALFRQIVKKVTEELALPNVIYVNGTTILTSPAKLSSGLVHPNPDGVLEMTENLCEVIGKYLK